jgi:hypothetical protein
LPQVTVVIGNVFFMLSQLGGMGVRSLQSNAKGDPKVARFLCSGDLPNDLEISAAAMVHPNTAAVVTPTPALPA